MNDAEDGENYDDENQLNSAIDAELDPNHTHFVLVDDGSSGIYGKEIEFRSKFENELRKGKSNIFYENSRINKRKRFDFGGLSYDNMPPLDDDYENDDGDDKETDKLKNGLKKDIIPMVVVFIMQLNLYLLYKWFYANS